MWRFFAVGRSYLVDGHTYEGHYGVSACSNTSPAESAGVEIHRPPLAGVRVTAAGPGAPLVTFTDHRGQFTFRDVAPGTYWVVAHVSPPLSAEGSGPGLHRGMDDPEAVEIVECPVRLFFLASKEAPRP